MKITHNPLKRNIAISDYIPLQVRTDNEWATDYLCINKSDHSMLELGFFNYDSTIHCITLLICQDYKKIDECYQIPRNLQTGDVLAESADNIETQTFRCEIYYNAVKVVVSDAAPDVCVSSGCVVWELTGKGDLVSLCVVDSTGAMSEHCYKELEYNR